MKNRYMYYYLIGMTCFLILTGIILFIFNMYQSRVYIDGIIEPYTDKDRTAVIKIFQDNKTKLVGAEGDFTYQIDNKALAPQENKGNLYIAVAKNKDGQVVGFIFYDRYFVTTGRIYYLVVDEKYRNKKFATALLQYAVDDLRKRECSREVIIYVKPDNMAAINLYKKLGFALLEAHGDYEIVLKKTF